MNIFLSRLKSAVANTFGATVTKEDIQSGYMDILGRFPSEDETEYYIRGKCTKQKLWDILFSSEEYANFCKDRIASREDILRLAQALFGKLLSMDETELCLQRKETISHLFLKWFDDNRIYRSRELARADIMDGYESLLGRFPLQSDIDYWFGSQYTLTGFLELLWSSEERVEYSQRKLYSRYGISTLTHNGISYELVFDRCMKDAITTAVAQGRFIWDDEAGYFSLLPSKGFFLDLGANIGGIAMMLAAKGWSGFCIEASDMNVECLKRSILLNNADIKVGQFAVTDKSGSVEFFENGPWGVIANECLDVASPYSPSALREQNPVKQMASFCLNDWGLPGTNMRHIEKIDFIKMDIEGSEYAALAGMDAFLESFGYPPIFSEVNGYNLFTYQKTPKSLFYKFKSLGYTPYQLYNDYLIVFDIDRMQIKLFDNYLFIHESDHSFDTKKSKTILPYSEEETIVEILKVLSDSWHQPQKALLYSLQDYPKLLNDARIAEALNNEAINAKDEITKKALDWYWER